jgi:hypothetical protein
MYLPPVTDSRRLAGMSQRRLSADCLCRATCGSGLDRSLASIAPLSAHDPGLWALLFAVGSTSPAQPCGSQRSVPRKSWAGASAKTCGGHVPNNSFLAKAATLKHSQGGPADAHRENRREGLFSLPEERNACTLDAHTRNVVPAAPAPDHHSQLPLKRLTATSCPQSQLTCVMPWKA